MHSSLYVSISEKKNNICIADTATKNLFSRRYIIYVKNKNLWDSHNIIYMKSKQ